MDVEGVSVEGTLEERGMCKSLGLLFFGNILGEDNKEVTGVSIGESIVPAGLAVESIRESRLSSLLTSQGLSTLRPCHKGLVVPDSLPLHKCTKAWYTFSSSNCKISFFAVKNTIGS